MRALNLCFAHASDYGKEGYLKQGTEFAGLFLSGGIIIHSMKRLLPLIVAIALLQPVAAETAQLYTPMEPGFTTQAGTFFSPEALEGLSDEFPIGSVITVSDEATDLSVSVTITGPLPELPGNRNLALTRRAFSELGDADGVADVTITVMREGTSRETNEQTGWYSFDLGLYSPESAYTLYEKLEENNLRPYAYKENEGVRIKVRHVLAFRLDQAISTLQALGIKDIQAEMEPNPYLS